MADRSLVQPRTSALELGLLVTSGVRGQSHSVLNVHRVFTFQCFDVCIDQEVVEHTETHFQVCEGVLHHHESILEIAQLLDVNRQSRMPTQKLSVLFFLATRPVQSGPCILKVIAGMRFEECLWALLQGLLTIWKNLILRH
jgi:hypothetical protein